MGCHAADQKGTECLVATVGMAHTQPMCCHVLHAPIVSRRGLALLPSRLGGEASLSESAWPRNTSEGTIQSANSMIRLAGVVETVTVGCNKQQLRCTSQVKGE